jgi:hypothetical protein
LTAYAPVATVLGSIPTFVGIVEFEGLRNMVKLVLIIFNETAALFMTDKV